MGQAMRYSTLSPAVLATPEFRPPSCSWTTRATCTARLNTAEARTGESSTSWTQTGRDLAAQLHRRRGWSHAEYSAHHGLRRHPVRDHHAGWAFLRFFDLRRGLQDRQHRRLQPDSLLQRHRRDDAVGDTHSRFCGKYLQYRHGGRYWLRGGRFWLRERLSA